MSYTPVPTCSHCTTPSSSRPNSATPSDTPSDENQEFVPRPQRPPTPPFGLRSYQTALKSPESKRSKSKDSLSSSHSIKIVSISRGTQTLNHLKSRAVAAQTSNPDIVNSGQSDHFSQTEFGELSDHSTQTEELGTSQQHPIELNQELISRDLSVIIRNLTALRGQQHMNSTCANSQEINHIWAKTNSIGLQLSKVVKLQQQQSRVRFEGLQSVENNLNQRVFKHIYSLFIFIAVLLTIILIICIVLLWHLLFRTI